jgi:hypothetical protein
MALPGKSLEWILESGSKGKGKGMKTWVELSPTKVALKSKVGMLEYLIQLFEERATGELVRSAYNDDALAKAHAWGEATGELKIILTEALKIEEMSTF